MKPLVSVIVPVYMVEKYLVQCLNSLINQTLKDMEIILVDDGSEDSSPIICDEYAQKYDFIKVIHQENKGLPAARNSGIKIAQGRYILFVDSDDTVKNNMLERMTQVAKEKKVDVVIAGYETFPNGKCVCPNFTKNTILSPNELINSCNTIHTGNELCFSWRFLIDKYVIDKKQIYFDESILFGEDVIFNIDLVMNADSIYVIDDCLYNYRIDNQNSIMRAKYKPDLENKIEIQYNKKCELTKKYSLEKNKYWMEDLSYYYISGFANMLFTNAKHGPKEDRKAAIKRAIRLPLLHDNYVFCRKKLFKHGRKNGLFRLACLLKIDPIVVWYVNKYY